MTNLFCHSFYSNETRLICCLQDVSDIGGPSPAGIGTKTKVKKKKKVRFIALVSFAGSCKIARNIACYLADQAVA